MLTIYVVSLVVICIVAAGAVAHPQVPTGIGGTVSLAALTLSALGAIETTQPAPSTVGLALSGALVAVWLATRWTWRRSRLRRRLQEW